MDTLELAVRQPLDIKLDDTINRVEFPLSAVAAIEEDLGRGMKTLPDWFRIQTKEVPAILRHGLTQLKADDAKETADLICENLDPEGIDTLIDALCASAFPRQVARFKEEIKKMQTGGTLPNAPSGAA